MNGNTEWAGRYAGELRRVVVEHAARAPRTLQQHLGPSELGHVCSRQVVGKMAGTPATNHVHDPWPSVMGTAGHAWMEEALRSDNERNGLRWLPERKVKASRLPGNPGTADAYDGREFAVVDWKFLGKTTLEKTRRNGPPLKYRVQLKIYGAGYAALGLPVTRVVLVAFPRTASTLDGLYVWEEPWHADDPELEWVYRVTPAREAVARLVAGGQLDINQVPATPSDEDCIWCPLFRPDATGGGAGCPGTKLIKGER
jgi:hypothetical protein